MNDLTHSRGKLRVAADIGGTFTDVAVFNEETQQFDLGKTLSTPNHLVDGIVDGMCNTGATIADTSLFLHGSTIAINTMLERTGAKTALLITDGFRDIYEIGRINRPDSFNLFFSKHEPLVPRHLRFEVYERLLADGSVETPLDIEQVAEIADKLEHEEIEAVAILLLHSYRNPEHEKRIKDYLESRLEGVFVSASHELSQEYREFERVSTVAANAYVGPRLSRYLSEIEGHLERQEFNGSFMIVQSTGGLYTARQAQRECVRMLESGPAAGVIGAQALCAQLGISNAIAFDMGGTTAKAGVIRDGAPMTTGLAMVGGYLKGLPIQISMIDISEVGTGGGSIAQVAAGGALRVGPRSAGAEPGPVCYGRGGAEPTVTDANLVLGRIGADRFLGGEMPLDAAAAAAAIRERLAGPLGMDATDVADGVLTIAVNAMALAVRGVTTDRGHSIGEFGTLIAFGGAGPLHACDVASVCGIPRVIIPDGPGHFSAIGMLFSDLRYDYVRSVFMPLGDSAFDALGESFADMETAGADAVAATGVQSEKVVSNRALDMRYVGQEHAVTVDLPAAVFENRDVVAIRALFDASHAIRYGFAWEDQPIQIVSARSTVFGLVEKSPPAPIESGGPKPSEAAANGVRPVYFRAAGGFVDCPVHARHLLKAGNRIAGPALVEETASTTVVPPGWALEVDAIGNLVLTASEED